MTESLEQEIRTLRSLFWSDRDPDGRGFAPLADAYRRAGEVRQALDLLADGLVRHPEFVPGHVVAAELYVEQGLHAEGELAARRALELDPENVNALRSLTTVLQESGRESEAGDVRARLTDLEPELRPPAPPAPPAPDLPWDPGAAEAEGIGTLEEPAAETAVLEPDPWIAEGGDVREEAPLGSQESVFELGDLAPDGAPTDAQEPRMMAHYEPTDEIVELTDLGPDAPLGSEEAVFELGDLAPVEEALDIGSMAPDGPAEEAFDIGSMAPDEPVEEALDIGSMAPDGPVEEAFDIGSIAPDEPVEEALDIGSMAPDAPAEEALDIGSMAPDAPVVETVDPSEPIYTRTLAELYVRQGFTQRAIEVLGQLLEEDPSDTDLAMRLSELQAGASERVAGPWVDESAPSDPEVSPEPEGWPPPPEEEVETQARDLTEVGESHEVDSPFAWTEEQGDDESASGPTIGEYFDGLLSWQPEDRS